MLSITGCRLEDDTGAASQFPPDWPIHGDFTASGRPVVGLGPPADLAADGRAPGRRPPRRQPHRHRPTAGLPAGAAAGGQCLARSLRSARQPGADVAAGGGWRQRSAGSARRPGAPGLGPGGARGSRHPAGGVLPAARLSRPRLRGPAAGDRRPPRPRSRRRAAGQWRRRVVHLGGPRCRRRRRQPSAHPRFRGLPPRPGLLGRYLAAAASAAALAWRLPPALPPQRLRPGRGLPRRCRFRHLPRRTGRHPLDHQPPQPHRPALEPGLPGAAAAALRPGGGG